jgi:predicted PurR-regulated permease PerM
MEGPTISGLIDRLAELSGGIVDLRAVDLSAQAKIMLAASSDKLVSITSSVITNLARFIASLAFFVFILFFLYLDGKELLALLIDAIPLRNAYTVGFMKKFRDTGKELVIGYLLMAVFQGLMAFLVYLIMKVPAPLTLAALTGISSLIPFVGSGLVWVPIVISRFMTGVFFNAFLLLVLCAFFISTLDNFIRPFVLHSRIKLHPLLIFMAILGGLSMFGFNGLILGPIILVLFFSAAELFAQVYGNKPSGEKSETRGQADD